MIVYFINKVLFKRDLNIALYQGFPILILLSSGATRFLVVVEASCASGMFITHPLGGRSKQPILPSLQVVTTENVSYLIIIAGQN